MKLQPNFSWQKYEDNLEDSREQFQYQLQNEHILVANSINTTIDDLSYWTKPRPTAFTWVNGRQIWRLTLPTATWIGNTNTIALGLTPITVIDIRGVISSGSLSLPIPYVDATAIANNISAVVNGSNVVLTSGGTNYSAYSGYITIIFTRT